jgi:hypothetical protein
MSILLSALATWLAVNLAIVAALYFKPFDFKPFGARLQRWPRPGPLAFARPRRRRF